MPTGAIFIKRAVGMTNGTIVVKTPFYLVKQGRISAVKVKADGRVHPSWVDGSAGGYLFYNYFHALAYVKKWEAERRQMHRPGQCFA